MMSNAIESPFHIENRRRQISEPLYAEIAELTYKQCGVDLRIGKRELVSARLAKKAQEMECDSLECYYRTVKSDHSGKMLIAMLDALTTNHTAFLRERQHFDYLAQRASSLFMGRQSLRIWSAAAATGEEVYTLLMVLIEALQLPFPSAHTESCLKVVGTDISTKALEVADAGIYCAEKMDPLPLNWQKKYFLRGKASATGMFRVRPELRRMACFSRLNLIEPIPSHQLYPVIFCRNAMIYFDQETKRRVVKSLISCLEPKGLLMIGHAESLTGVSNELTYLHPALYQNREQLSTVPLNKPGSAA